MRRTSSLHTWSWCGNNHYQETNYGGGAPGWIGGRVDRIHDRNSMGDKTSSIKWE